MEGYRMKSVGSLGGTEEDTEGLADSLVIFTSDCLYSFPAFWMSRFRDL
jgi:hypothetical protein